MPPMPPRFLRLCFVMMKWSKNVLLVVLTLCLILYKAAQVTPNGSPHQSFSSRDTNTDSSDTAAAKQTLIVKDPTTTDHPTSKVHHLAQLSSPDEEDERGSIHAMIYPDLAVQWTASSSTTCSSLPTVLGRVFWPAYVHCGTIHS